MTTFEDLNFRPHPVHLSGVQAVEYFDNGYGVSVICTPFSYGSREGLFELAVMRCGDLCYDTPITDDVLGHLTPDDVTALIERVKNL